MKKLTNANLPSGEDGIKEAMKRMIDGEVFYHEGHEFSYIHAKVSGLSPFGCATHGIAIGKSWRSVHEWQVEADVDPLEDASPEKPVLCWYEAEYCVVFTPPKADRVSIFSFEGWRKDVYTLDVCPLTDSEINELKRGL